MYHPTATPVRKITAAVLQSAFSQDTAANVRRMERAVRDAAQQGAQLILMPELFETWYFCQEEKQQYFALAHPVEGHPTLLHFQKLAKELAVVLPVSFFEKAGPVYYNSCGMIDADGTLLGVYRKSHIPDGPGYEEKFYFRPGNTGFKVWKTKIGNLGVGICWDQWFPECARALALQGAELLLYPTAIGSEPNGLDTGLDTKDPWQRVMIGHAVANMIPVLAANRVGQEGTQSFYGHSFLVNHLGEKQAELNREESGVALATFDLQKIQLDRAAFGFFRDRRPELYHDLTTP